MEWCSVQVSGFNDPSSSLNEYLLLSLPCRLKLEPQASFARLPFDGLDASAGEIRYQVAVSSFSLRLNMALRQF